MILSIRRTEHDLCTHISFRFNKYIREHNNIYFIQITLLHCVYSTALASIIIFNVTTFKDLVDTIFFFISKIFFFLMIVAKTLMQSIFFLLFFFFFCLAVLYYSIKSLRTHAIYTYLLFLQCYRCIAYLLNCCLIILFLLFSIIFQIHFLKVESRNDILCYIVGVIRQVSKRNQNNIIYYKYKYNLLYQVSTYYYLQ